MYDVIVIGGGNAALCAAITARQNGALKVLILESAPKDWRGGNSRHTRNFRAQHDAPTKTLTEIYSREEYMDDLLRVTGGITDKPLAEMMIAESGKVMGFMEECGVRFQPSLSGTLSLSRTNAFFLGGGKALVNAYYLTAKKLNIEVRYEAEVVDIAMKNNFIEGVFLASGEMLTAKNYIAASGGFQGNIDMLADYWGEAAYNFRIRGTPYAKGVVLKNLLAQGVQAVGDPTQFHAVAIDGRAPRFDGGIVTRLDCIPFSLVVNKHAKRFYDEGEDVWPKRYAIWGRLVAQQPDQIAYSIFDAKCESLFMPSVYPSIKADTLEELAGKLNLDATTLHETVNSFNNTVVEGKFNGKALDECRTQGLEINKTHWARKLEAPFRAYPLCPGITFTYLGVKVNAQAQVLMQDGSPTQNLFACGEIMAGNILGKGYIAGIGMTIGTIFGRIAGKGAAHATTY